MVYEVLITCNSGKRDHAIQKLKELHDVKNIQQRERKNEVLAQSISEDKNYVITNLIHKIEDVEGIREASVLPI